MKFPKNILISLVILLISSSWFQINSNDTFFQNSSPIDEFISKYTKEFVEFDSVLIVTQYMFVDNFSLLIEFKDGIPTNEVRVRNKRKRNNVHSKKKKASQNVISILNSFFDRDYLYLNEEWKCESPLDHHYKISLRILNKGETYERHFNSSCLNSFENNNNYQSLLKLIKRGSTKW